MHGEIAVHIAADKIKEQLCKVVLVCPHCGSEKLTMEYIVLSTIFGISVKYVASTSWLALSVLEAVLFIVSVWPLTRILHH